MTQASHKRIDRLGCFQDARDEAIDKARYEAHLSEHMQYPQSWCGWCEEEKEQEKAKPNGIAETIKRLRRRSKSNDL